MENVPDVAPGRFRFMTAYEKNGNLPIALQRREYLGGDDDLRAIGWCERQAETLRLYRFIVPTLIRCL
jgi:hypothetical protein